MPQILETAMLVCFGLSWPLSIARSWKARSAKGKSLPFMVAIAVGYAVGVAAKLVGGQVNYVIAFYMANFVMVCIDIALYFRNRRLDRSAHG